VPILQITGSISDPSTERSAVKQPLIESHVAETAPFRATFPFRLWATALVAACVLIWYFGIPGDSESVSAQVPSVPPAAATSGNAG